MCSCHSRTSKSVFSHQVKEVHLRESCCSSIVWDGWHSLAIFLVARKRTWKKERITWAFVWSWVFSKNYIHRYPSSAGGTNFGVFFSFCALAGPNPPQSLHIFESRRKGSVACMCSDLSFDLAFVTACVLQVFIQARLYLNKKQKNKIHGLAGLHFKTEIILSREESSQVL